MIRYLALVAVLTCLAACTAPAAPDGRAPTSTTAPDYPEGYTESPEAGRSCPDAPGGSLDPAAGPLGPDGRPDGDTVRRIRAEGLVVGVSQTAQFLSTRDLATGELTGFEVEIAREVAAALGLPAGGAGLDLVSLPTGRRLLALKTSVNEEKRSPEIREVDLVIASVSVTCGREQEYGLRYSRPYRDTHSGLLVRSGLSGVTGPQDLTGRKVCAGDKTTNSDEILEIRDEQRRRDPGRALVAVTVSDTSDCLMLLQRGLVDAVYSDVVILLGYQYQTPGTVLLDYRHPRSVKTAVAVSGEQPDLVRFVNRVLDDLRGGRLEAIYDEQFARAPTKLPLRIPDEPYQR
ncbi:transporter substrate-binding domain-containing protein [Actinosynnema sp. NPDC023587]|uniref:transporter substrate-binding domain-containing protein n=1 Tax=Actinosynnema sp. NPDC023587 TaxID=3154695 RepID=UPI0033EBCB3C